MININISCLSEAQIVNEDDKMKQNFITNHFNDTSQNHSKSQFNHHNVNSRVKKQTFSIEYIDTITGQSPFKLYCPFNENLSFVWTKDNQQLMMDYSYMFLMPPNLFINEPKTGRDSGIFECNLRRYQFIFPNKEKTQPKVAETKNYKSLIFILVAVAIVILLIVISCIIIKISKVHTQAITNYVKVWVMLKKIDLREAVKEEMAKAKEEEEEEEEEKNQILEEEDIVNYAFAALLK